MVGVYKITNPKGLVYIGSSKDIDTRWKWYKKLRCNSQTKLCNSLIKYGVDNHIFEVIEECDIEILLERELFYGTFYECLDKKIGLNCRLPKSMEGYVYMSQDTKDKIGASNKSINVGKVHGHYESSLKKLTPEQVREIKLLLIENKLTQKEISDLYSVSRRTIGLILIEKRYKTIATDLDLSLRKKQYVKLEECDYNEIKKLNKEGVSQTKIAQMYGVNQSHISKIINNENYIKTMNINKDGRVSH
jgi:group I intron endonuclease